MKKIKTIIAKWLSKNFIPICRLLAIEREYLSILCKNPETSILITNEEIVDRTKIWFNDFIKYFHLKAKYDNALKGYIVSLDYPNTTNKVNVVAGRDPASKNQNDFSGFFYKENDKFVFKKANK